MARGMGGHSPSNVSHNLRGIDFPADKQALIKHAQRNGAEREVIDTLEQMPDERYENMAEVMKGYSQRH